jgi:2-polyprenyl-3-methyl-5-hydroxy-6-metoxy-1,4-benzoquinol methylase
MPLNHIFAGIAGLAARQLHPEIMDQAGLDEKTHRSALSGLRRINLASGICKQLCRQLMAYSRSQNISSLRVLDIASGGGDVPLGLWKRARNRGLRLEILGLDRSAIACEFATLQCQAAGGAIVFDQCDVTCNSIPNGFDVVTCSLFLHHLTHEQASALLVKMAAAAPLMLVSDLRRCVGGYLLAHLACRLLTLSPVVRYDGPQSVANAFTTSEMRDLLKQVGLRDAEIRKVWPFRLMVERKLD